MDEDSHAGNSGNYLSMRSSSRFPLRSAGLWGQTGDIPDPVAPSQLRARSQQDSLVAGMTGWDCTSCILSS